MEDAIGEVETIEFDNPNLQLENDDQLETSVYGSMDNFDEEQNDAIAAISKNLSPQTIAREKTTKKAFFPISPPGRPYC